ncbi:ATP synthase subunit C [Aminivibrio sp.]|jgi:V/A-type H+-transporting ATPase subunit K|uniref:ATP synthase subunit C n=1 Tax=Aminivibrio sp. TaxID=1872489 RepID=UPI0016A915F8|nr:ATP synthase subunit C [Synergistaceae bacterium]MDD3391357.1 ATP synthase subunit C [Synergistaceae bacterium]MDD4022183.1 ATP synthase subunit C [Synergistaceae bacterium]MDD4613470.1 ATP synthase subunit C [Synergistaceae bacterium]NLO58793.1 ATPase [Synergistaceae bacterium]
MSGLVLITGGTALACVTGFYLRGRTVRSPRTVLGGALALMGVLLVFGLALTLLPSPSTAAETSPASAASGLGFLGASLATGLACLGAGIAVAVVGAAALGVVGEKPSMLGTTLIYLGLAEGIAIYGVIVSLLILGKL